MACASRSEKGLKSDDQAGKMLIGEIGGGEGIAQKMRVLKTDGRVLYKRPVQTFSSPKRTMTKEAKVAIRLSLSSFFPQAFCFEKNQLECFQLSLYSHPAEGERGGGYWELTSSLPYGTLPMATFTPPFPLWPSPAGQSILFLTPSLLKLPLPCLKRQARRKGGGG